MRRFGGGARRDLGGLRPPVDCRAERGFGASDFLGVSVAGPTGPQTRHDGLGTANRRLVGANPVAGGANRF